MAKDPHGPAAGGEADAAAVPDCLPDIHSALVAAIREEPGVSGVELSDLRRTATGFSRENWTLDATLHFGSHARVVPLIVRRDPEGTLLDTDREHEISVLRALQPTAVPAPEVLWADPHGSRFGRPTVVLRREEGECDWWVLNSARPLAERLVLADQFIELLAKVQDVPLSDLRGSTLTDPGPAAASHELEHWCRLLAENALEAQPELELAHAWLADRLFESPERVLVHGDFKPGNILLHDSRSPILLDWETAHLGDPLEDLGGITNPVRAREQMIRGSWQRAQIVAAYERHSGRRVNLEELAWWNVFANFKLATIVLTGVKAWITGRFDRIMEPPTGLYRKMFDLMESDPRSL